MRLTKHTLSCLGLLILLIQCSTEDESQPERTSAKNLLPGDVLLTSVTLTSESSTGEEITSFEYDDQNRVIAAETMTMSDIDGNGTIDDNEKATGTYQFFYNDQDQLISFDWISGVQEVVSSSVTYNEDGSVKSYERARRFASEETISFSTFRRSFRYDENNRISSTLDLFAFEAETEDLAWQLLEETRGINTNFTYETDRITAQDDGATTTNYTLDTRVNPLKDNVALSFVYLNWTGTHELLDFVNSHNIASYSFFVTDSFNGTKEFDYTYNENGLPLTYRETGKDWLYRFNYQ